MTFKIDSGCGGPEESAENVAPFKVLIETPDEDSPHDTQRDQSSAEREDY